MSIYTTASSVTIIQDAFQNRIIPVVSQCLQDESFVESILYVILAIIIVIYVCKTFIIGVAIDVVVVGNNNNENLLKNHFVRHNKMMRIFQPKPAVSYKNEGENQDENEKQKHANSSSCWRCTTKVVNDDDYDDDVDSHDKDATPYQLYEENDEITAFDIIEEDNSYNSSATTITIQVL